MNKIKMNWKKITAIIFMAIIYIAVLNIVITLKRQN